MHVGYTMSFQGQEGRMSDLEVYRRELRLLELAIDLGFEGAWNVEHHFTNYVLTPDPLQMLAWVAARHPDVRIGTSVIVLPWHDPVRVAEQVIQLDNLSGGRLLVGLGRGIGRTEYDGFRVDMSTARERFVSYTRLLLDAFRTGFVEADDEFLRQPRREIRPRATFDLAERVYAAAGSPESMPLMAELGIGMLVITQKAWDLVAADIATYRATWSEVHGTEPPAPICSGQVLVDADPRRAEELARRHMGQYYDSVISHYGFDTDDHTRVKGFENYRAIKQLVDAEGRDKAVEAFIDPLPWGTPDQVLEQLRTQLEVTGMSAYNPSFCYGDMTDDEAEASLRLFAREVLPELRSWPSRPLPDATRAPAVAR